MLLHLLTCVHFFVQICSTLAADQLLLTQILWRHGDRSPYGACKGDPTQEEDWPQGFGQLTILGMRQEVALGKIIYNRYVKEHHFLNASYNAWEVYVRAADVNRTLSSAIANFIGFYQNGNNKAGIDYPDSDWPANYVPIAIHSHAKDSDHMLEPSSNCARQKWLDKLLEKTPEFQELNKSSQPLMNTMSKICKQPINLNNEGYYADTFRCDYEYKHPIPMNISVVEELLRISDTVDDYKNGLYIKPYDGINFKFELAKIRGGTLLWNMIRHMELKLYCIKEPSSENCGWMKKLKYYAYSAHGSTITALLAAMNAKRNITTGHPDYSAAVFVELWNTTNGPAVKFFYHPQYNASPPIDDITVKINGCSKLKDGFCLLSDFRTAAIEYYPGNILELCQDVTTKSTSFNPDGSLNATSSSHITNSIVTTTPKSSSHLTNSLILIIVMLITQRLTYH